MRQSLCATLILGLLPVLVSAQELLPNAALQMGLPSAALDRRPPDGLLSRDLFRADPTTYAPGFHEPPRFDSRFVPCCGGVAGPVFTVPGAWWPAQPQVVYVPYVIEREVPRAAPAPVPPPAAAPPPPPPAPGPPKTFYVIPGCYAGDRPPLPDALPRGCSLSRLRTIPPVIR